VGAGRLVSCVRGTAIGLGESHEVAPLATKEHRRGDLCLDNGVAWIVSVANIVRLCCRNTSGSAVTDIVVVIMQALCPWQK
jgi:hypothetical protein